MTSNYLRHATLTLSNQTSRYIKSELEFWVIAEPETFIDREGKVKTFVVVFFVSTTFYRGEGGVRTFREKQLDPRARGVFVGGGGGGGGGAYHYF